VATGAQDSAPPGTVGLDDLLRLPKSYDARSGEKRGGATAVEWRTRFANATQAIAVARAELEDAQAQLEDAVGDVSTWKVATPLGGGASSDSAPVSFSARAKVRKQREAVEQAERKLRELDVEADLAGVPAEWRRVAPQAE